MTHGANEKTKVDRPQSFGYSIFGGGLCFSEASLLPCQAAPHTANGLLPVCSFVLVLTLALTVSMSSAQNYTMLDLGFPQNIAGSASEGHGVNQRGAAVGTWWDGGSSHGNQYAFLYSNGVMTNLGTLKSGGYDYAIAYGINNSNRVVGQATSSGSATYHAFGEVNGVMTDLDNTGQSWSSANGINQCGQIVGEFTTGTGLVHAFIYTNGVFFDLGTLGGTYSSAKCINDFGVIVGAASDSSDHTYAFVYSNGVMSSLGTLGGNYSTAYGINNSGVIVGESSVASGETHAFIYRNGAMTDLGTFGGTNSTAQAVNNGGEVAGYALTADQLAHAFLFDGTTLRDLHTRFVTPVGWSNIVTYAYGINDAGQVVGAASYVTNGSVTKYDAILLTPPVLSLTVSSNITVTATSSNGAVVVYNTVANGGCSAPNIVSTKASGSIFPIGITIVTNIATDVCGDTTNGTFTVTVRPLPTPMSLTPSIATNGFGLTISGVASQSYVVQGSSNLINWVPLRTNILLGSSTNWMDYGALTSPARFYRTVTLAP
ncbi:MAG TPA: HYR domain-containing protein [Verrucomicrobiae bacterium]